MNSLSTEALESGPKVTQLRAWARRELLQASLLRDEAANLRLKLWLKRLASLDRQTRRTAFLNVVLDAATSVCSSDYASIQLVDSHARGLKLAAHRGFKEPFLHFFEFVADDHTACAVALKQGRTVLVPDITTSPIFLHAPALEVLLDANVRAVKSAPLIAPTGQVFGVLSVHYRQPQRYSHGDVVRFNMLARQIARLLDTRFHRRASALTPSASRSSCSL